MTLGATCCVTPRRLARGPVTVLALMMSPSTNPAQPKTFTILVMPFRSVSIGSMLGANHSTTRQHNLVSLAGLIYQARPAKHQGKCQHQECQDHFHEICVRRFNVCTGMNHQVRVSPVQCHNDKSDLSNDETPGLSLEPKWTQDWYH